jgi:formiminotetrahydrofolate cyclodeaminase
MSLKREDSIWTTTLAAFREESGGAHPVPAGVAISAVTASLALALFAKVLNVTGKRKNFTGDRQRLAALLDAVRAESTLLTHLADDDVQAFNHYMDRKRQGEDLAAAIRNAIEVPMNAARSAVRGLDLCAEAAGMMRGLTAADLGAAAVLLSGAVRAMSLSVGINIREMPSEEQFSAAITAECRDLELRAVQSAEAVTAVINVLLG